MRRVYSLPLAAVCIVLLASLVGGCFGSSDEPTTATSETTATSVVTTSTTDSSTTTDGMSTTTDGVTTTTDPNRLVDGLPVAYRDSLGQRPIVVMFYVPGGVDDESVLATLTELQGLYDSYTFMVYDYTTPAVYGDLAKELDIGYPPQIVEIDREGVTQTVWNGYVDKGTLNQSLLDLGRY